MSQNIPSFGSANLIKSENGQLNIPYRFEFGANTTLSVDLTQEVEFSKMGFVQSVYIDNADNSANFDLYFQGVGGATNSYRVRAQPYSQGWYPVAMPMPGAFRLVAISQAGVNVPVLFSNYWQAYYSTLAPNGAYVVPALTNSAVDGVAIGAGLDVQLVGGLPAKSVSLYRGMFTVDQATILKFRSGSGGATLFAAQLTAGGSITFQGSGISWFATAVADGLFLYSSVNVNVLGGFGYVQN